MGDVDYYLGQARTCFAQARGCSNPAVAAELERMGREYLVQAEACAALRPAAGPTRRARPSSSEPVQHPR